MKYLMIAIAALFLTTHTARADQCDNMASAIVSKVDGLTVEKRTPANFIPLSGEDHGAYLNCQGPFGMSLRIVGKSDSEWLSFVGRVASILTGRSPDDVMQAFTKCVNTAPPPGDVHSVSFAGFKLFCEFDPSDKTWELLITQRS